MVVKRFDIVLINLDPTVGKEINKVRPAIIISPDEINQRWQTILIVPMTTVIRNLGFRLNIRFENKDGQACVDQMRGVDKSRIVKKLGKLPTKFRDELLEICQEMFRK